MMTTEENDPIPFVDYYCACSAKSDLPIDAKPLSTAENALATGRHLLSNEASNYLYPLSRLYFCEDCHQIRCPSCVQDEIVSYYCPNCLFEVKEINKCILDRRDQRFYKGTHSQCQK